MSPQEIYLDNAATTQPHPAVVEAMTHALTQAFGNPSSLHRKGLDAERLVSRARENVAGTLAVSPVEVIFTSGGTESNCLAIYGTARRSKSGHLITTAIEHASVLTPIHRLANDGCAITVLPVDGEGRIEPDQIAHVLRPDTVLVSVMAVNNEIGTVQPIEAIGRLLEQHRTRSRHLLFHVDAVQAWGKIPLHPAAWGVDLMSLSAHKVHGPKGSGALYVRRGAQPLPLLGGGEQEGALRPGTENVPGIVGLGAAAAVMSGDLLDAAQRMARLRDRLRERLSRIPAVRFNTPAEGAAPHILNASFPGVRGETLLHRLEMDGIFTSTGSACHSHDPTPSHVLIAIGLSADLAASTVRFSLSRFNTAEEIATASDAVAQAVSELRALVR